jgi:hypothetical protein
MSTRFTGWLSTNAWSREVNGVRWIALPNQVSSIVLFGVFFFRLVSLLEPNFQICFFSFCLALAHMFQEGERHTPAHENRVNPRIQIRNLIYVASEHVPELASENCGLWCFDWENPYYRCLCLRKANHHEELATERLLVWLAERIAFVKTSRLRAIPISERCPHVRFHRAHFEEAFELVLKRLRQQRNRAKVPNP